MTHVYANDPRGQWMGVLPEGWESTRLPLLSVHSNVGTSIKSSERFDGVTNFYTCAMEPFKIDVRNVVGLKDLTGDNDLLLNRMIVPYVRAPLLPSAYSEHVYKVELVDTCNRYYVKYALMCASKYIRRQGVAIDSLNFQRWSQLVFPLPPKDVQEKIAGYLDREVSLMDHQMDAIKQSIPLLEKRRESVIFHAVTGRYKDLLVGDVGDDVNAYVGDPRADWMGELPQGWCATRLPLVIDEKNRGVVVSKEHWHVGSNVLYTCSKDWMLTDFSDFDDDILTNENDLLLACMANPYVFVPIKGSIYSNIVCRIRISDTIFRNFLAYALTSASRFIRRQGVTMDSFNFQRWGQLVFPLPNRETQQAIADYLDVECGKIDRTIDLYRQMYDVLKQRRESVIYEAVTGKIPLENMK